jgi:hypothetical protein
VKLPARAGRWQGSCIGTGRKSGIASPGFRFPEITDLKIKDRKTGEQTGDVQVGNALFSSGGGGGRAVVGAGNVGGARQPAGAEYQQAEIHEIE